MILKYGSYAHDPNEATLAITRQPRRNAAGQIVGYVERWRIAGVKQAATQADLTTALAALKAAYASGGSDLRLVLDDGVTATAHALLSAGSVGGTRVLGGVEFPVGRGAEYTTFRSYQVTVEADYLDSQVSLLSFIETLSFAGSGGPIFRYLPTLNGPWQRQTVAETSNYFVTQRGQAIGSRAYPAPTAPLWPAAEHRERRVIEYRSPRPGSRNSGDTEWPIAWTYVFESHAAMHGLPSRRG
jgi:hypothetical protein